MKLVGLKYLQKVLGDIVADVIKHKKSCEVTRNLICNDFYIDRSYQDGKRR